MTGTDLDTTTAAEVVTSPQTFGARLTPEEARDRAQWVRQITAAALVKDVDYGIIPGTDKPTLLKPGAEMLLLAAGLGFTIRRLDDTDAAEHRGVTYRCTVHRGGQVVAECDGYAGYDESRFYTSAEDATQREREAAAKYQRNIRPSRCVEYRAPWNSVVKMAQKRALVGAALNAVAASGLFTQDVEDELESSAVPTFDPMALIGPHLDRLDAAGRKELSEWRKAAGLPDPRRMDASQAAAVLVRIGELLAHQPQPEPEQAESEQAEAETGVDVHQTPPTDTLSASEAQGVHRYLGRRGITSKDDQQALIVCCSNGRTAHASQLTRPEKIRVEQMADDIAEGRLPIDRVRAVVAETEGVTA